MVTVSISAGLFKGKAKYSLALFSTWVTYEYRLTTLISRVAIQALWYQPK